MSALRVGDHAFARASMDSKTMLGIYTSRLNGNTRLMLLRHTAGIERDYVWVAGTKCYGKIIYIYHIADIALLEVTGGRNDGSTIIVFARDLERK